jgi:hypothetical protein
LVLFSSLLLCNSLALQQEILSGEQGMSKVSAVWKGDAGSQNSRALSGQEAERLGEILETGVYCYGTTKDLDMKSSRTVQAKVLGTNSRYTEFHELEFVRGSFFTEEARKEGNAVAVLGSRLAQELFLTQDAVGMKVEILGREFTVCGVFEEDSSPASRLSEDGLSEAYIPADLLLELDKAAAVTFLEVETTRDSLSGRNTEVMEQALRTLGKNPDQYHITDWTVQQVFLRQKPLMAGFIAGAAVIILLAGFMTRATGEIYWVMRKGSIHEAPMEVIRKEGRTFAKLLTKIGIAAAGILLLYWRIRFPLYIPASYIPEELIDVSHFVRLVQDNVEEGVKNSGYIPAVFELQLEKTQILQAVLFWLGIPLGFLSLYLGLAGTGPGIKDRTAIFMASASAAALLLLWGLTVLLEVPYSIPIHIIFPFWCLLFYQIIKTKKGKGYTYVA